jgi:AcrR family transcriptional regulator
MSRSRSTPVLRTTLVSRALVIADGEGLAAVSFRRLADELGVTPMALYHHVRDKADLLAAMVDLLLSEVDTPPVRRSRGWAEELRALLRSFVSVRERHPSAGELLRSGPAQSPHVLRTTEAALNILRRAGFGRAASLHVLRQLSALLTPGAATPPAAHAPAEYAPDVKTWGHLDDLGVELLVLGVQGLLARGPTETATRRVRASKTRRLRGKT